MSFLVSLDGLVQIDNDARLGNHLKVFEIDIQKARRIIFPLLYDLHPVEATFVYLYVFQSKSQEEIASLFQVTQGAVSGRLRRAVERLKFIHSLPPLNRSFLPVLLTEFIPNPLWVRTMALMYESTSLAQVARLLGISQGGARQAFFSGLDLLDESFAELEKTMDGYKPSKEIQIFYRVLYRNQDNKERKLKPWVRRQLGKAIKAYRQITSSYSILSRDKCGIPLEGVVDLAGVN